MLLCDFDYSFGSNTVIGLRVIQFLSIMQHSQTNDYHFYHFNCSTNYVKYITCRRIRDELAKQNAETTDLTTKLDRVRIVTKQKKKIGKDFVFVSGNKTGCFTGNSCIEGSTRGSKIRSHKILHRYPRLNIRCRPCCSSHLDVKHKQLFFFFSLIKWDTWGKKNPNTNIVFLKQNCC